MRRALLALAITVPVLGACAGRMRVGWHPNVVSDVPDSTLVRFSTVERKERSVGRAVGWQRGSPALVTTSGDTLAIPADARFEVYLDKRGDHSVKGGIVGYAVAVALMLASCNSRGVSGGVCGEQDPTPILGAMLGGFIGFVIKKERWVRVARDTLPRR